MYLCILLAASSFRSLPHHALYIYTCCVLLKFNALTNGPLSSRIFFVFSLLEIHPAFFMAQVISFRSLSWSLSCCSDTAPGTHHLRMRTLVWLMVTAHGQLVPSRMAQWKRGGKLPPPWVWGDKERGEGEEEDGLFQVKSPVNCLVQTLLPSIK